MSEHDPDVVAVLAERFHGFNSLGECQCGYPTERSPEAMRTHQAEVALAALTAAGIACVYVPEGVVVEHGARLVPAHWAGPLYSIESPNEAP